LRFGDLAPDSRKLYDEIKAEKRSHVFARYQSEEFLKDPEQIWINNVYAELIAGRMTREQITMLCKISGKKYNNVRMQLNNKLKDNNDPKTFKDYCMSERQKKRRDILGFQQPKAIMAEEYPPSNLIKDSKPQDSAIAEDLPGSEDEDVLGFG